MWFLNFGITTGEPLMNNIIYLLGIRHPANKWLEGWWRWRHAVSLSKLGAGA